MVNLYVLKNAVCEPGIQNPYGCKEDTFPNGRAKITYEMELDSDVTGQEKMTATTHTQ